MGDLAARMDLFQHSDYKEVLKERVKELRPKRPGLTLKKLASKVPIQYTYLSRVLNDPATHINEDALFSLAHHLEFMPDEIEYLGLLRSQAATTSSKRKDFLGARIDEKRTEKKLSAAPSVLNEEEASYLLDPLCLITHASLDIEEFQKNPIRLCATLGITREKLTEILRHLNAIGKIELDEATLTVKKVLKDHVHYGRTNPLLRTHQQLMRNWAGHRLLSTSEDKKRSFSVTFIAHEAAFAEIQEEFQSFIKKIEKIVTGAKSEHTYQLFFDVLEWV